MELIAHRGGAGIGPENTLESISAGLAAGADGVEVDVRRTIDGALVLMHDADLSRTTGGTGRVEQSTLDALRDLDAGAPGIRVPILAEVLELVPPEKLLVLELKGHPWEAGYDPGEPAARALAFALAAANERRMVVSSFNPGALRVVREVAPDVRTAVLTTAAFDLASNLAAAIDGGHEECHVPASILGRSFVEEAHRSGRRVVAWTVDDAERLRTFAEWDVDACICDDPRAARHALAG